MRVCCSFSCPLTFLSLGKRVIFEDHENGWLHPAHGEPIVFVPDLWAHQFGNGDFVPFPNCSISGDSTWSGLSETEERNGEGEKRDLNERGRRRSTRKKERDKMTTSKARGWNRSNFLLCDALSFVFVFVFPIDYHAFLC